MDIPADVLKKLKCHQCDMYLSRGPVYLEHGGAAACGRCFSPKRPATRNKEYEAVAKLLRFPCKNRDLGCGETVGFEEVAHEARCSYRQYVCPVLGSSRCEWLGTRSQLLQHCQDQHPDHVLDNPCSLTHDITTSSLHNYLLQAFQLLFLLLTKVCVTSGKIYHSVRLLDRDDVAKDFTYTLHIKRNKEEITKRGDVAPQGVLALQEPTALHLDINSVLSMLGGWGGASCTVEVERRQTDTDQSWGQSTTERESCYWRRQNPPWPNPEAEDWQRQDTEGADWREQDTEGADWREQETGAQFKNTEDDPDSTVFGSLINGVFEGKIISPTGSFYVERSGHYFPHNQYNQSFHSVIYNENHIEDPYHHKREGHARGCGITEEVSQWMDQIKNSAFDPELYTIPIQQEKQFHIQKEDSSTPPRSSDGNLHMYSKRTNKSEDKKLNGRAKRATHTQEREYRNTCSLYIRTDPYLWKHIREGFPEHTDPIKEREINEKTREEILSLIAHHINAVNYIYSYTKFDGRLAHRNIQFVVHRIEIDNYSSCGGKNSTSFEKRFCMENNNVTNLLNYHSLDNHDDFCLAYLFTYRDFIGGSLGLAWQASGIGAPGGICEKHKTYTIANSGKYQSTKRSLNTGIISLSNYKTRVPPRISQLMLAHQIGHNFGSPHDFPDNCRPGGTSGNFIMFAAATSGTRPNNSKFSSCSIGNISVVLDGMTDNQRRNCFTSSSSSFCGNKIVERGEECDCGYDYDECKEKCCYPRIIELEDRMANKSAKGCNRRANTQCSPSEGPCCNSATCTFIPKSEDAVCRIESDCTFSASCSGLSPECPTPKPLPDYFRCNNSTQLCIAGECTESICAEYDLKECSLTADIIPGIDKGKMCELACQNGTDATTCRGTSEFAFPGVISLMPGSPCNNFQGYCDESLQCQPVEERGILNKRSIH